MHYRGHGLMEMRLVACPFSLSTPTMIRFVKSVWVRGLSRVDLHACPQNMGFA